MGWNGRTWTDTVRGTKELRRTGAIAHSTVEHSSSPIENILQTGLWITVYWINHFLALLRWSVWIQYTTPSSNCRGNKESKRSSRISSWGMPGWSRRSFFYGRLLPAISGGSSQAKLQATDFLLFLFYLYWKRDEIPSLIESGKSYDTSIPANKLT